MWHTFWALFPWPSGPSCIFSGESTTMLQILVPSSSERVASSPSFTLILLHHQGAALLPWHVVAGLLTYALPIASTELGFFWKILLFSRIVAPLQNLAPRACI